MNNVKRLTDASSASVGLAAPVCSVSEHAETKT